MISYNAGNSNNWQSVWSQSFTAEPAPGNSPDLERYFPLPEILMPIQLEASLITFMLPVKALILDGSSRQR
ncbi:hypothetical protein [Microcystis aeruginosa]|uniref:hypothetical protein n=1 Tax=Microcystis aeruginosa TaxID=1126 RepID=UPI001E32AFCF|nr:hypothetical protein [Microcystis aeruginosa]UGS10927.1 hypothetical protein LRR78_10190 [Microcystis aeruginosa FACHB-905 = DIANCHI905]